MKQDKWSVPPYTRRDGHNKCWVKQDKTPICRCFGSPKLAEERARRICHRENNYNKLLDACEKIDTEKMRTLADWLDLKDIELRHSGVEVQLDLRRWARIIERAIADAEKG